MKNTTIAVDLAKSVFQVAVSHAPGRVDVERRLSRERFLEYLRNASILPRARVSRSPFFTPAQPSPCTVKTS